MLALILNFKTTLFLVHIHIVKVVPQNSDIPGLRTAGAGLEMADLLQPLK